MKKHILQRRGRIEKKVRSRIIGKTEFPRLSVYRSNKHIFAQAIDDKKQITIAATSDKTIKEKMTKTEKAKHIGSELAKKLKELKINQVVFDRGSFKYAGRIKAVAEGLRESGITI